MKKIISASLLVTMALTGAHAISNSELAAKLNSLESELADLKKKLKKQNKKINKVKSHDSGDNIKWGADLRTSFDSLNYDLANGASANNDGIFALRLWLNMAYAPDRHNVFKGQLSMNKAFGADFTDSNFQDTRTFGLGGQFDWLNQDVLTDSTLRVRQAYWLYLGDSAFGADIPWTFSIGRRPSTAGFLANLREDDAAQSPLGHLINVEFDGLSSKLDLSNVTGVPGMSIKLCMGKGSSNAQPNLTATPYASGYDPVADVDLAGFIFEPYNDGQFIVKATAYRGFGVPGQNPGIDTSSGSLFLAPANPTGNGTFTTTGDMDGAGLSVMVDGLTEDGYLADAKVFGSFAWTKSHPDAGSSMLGSSESQTGTSYWVGTQLPVDDDGVFGLEYNHGSQYWRPFTYAEDTLIGSKLATRGDAFEAYFTYQLTDALSAQVRYTKIDYDYTGSNGFFGNLSGSATKISDIKDGAGAFTALGGKFDANGGVNLASLKIVGQNLGASGVPASQIPGTVQDLAGAALSAPSVVEAAQDLRIYLRYRF